MRPPAAHPVEQPPVVRAQVLAHGVGACAGHDDVEPRQVARRKAVAIEQRHRRAELLPWPPAVRRLPPSRSRRARRDWPPPPSPRPARRPRAPDTAAASRDAESPDSRSSTSRPLLAAIGLNALLPGLKRRRRHAKRQPRREHLQWSSRTPVSRASPSSRRAPRGAHRRWRRSSKTPRRPPAPRSCAACRRSGTISIAGVIVRPTAGRTSSSRVT